MKDYIYPVVLSVIGLTTFLFAFFGPGMDKMGFWPQFLMIVSGLTNWSLGVAQIRALRKPGGREHVRAINKA